jgi:hypothetical protein
MRTSTVLAKYSTSLTMYEFEYGTGAIRDDALYMSLVLTRDCVLRETEWMTS